MSLSQKLDKAGVLALLVLGLAGPLLFPAYTSQIAVLWLMVIFAVTWDMMGGQMGYNSLGNIFFFGAGMYICSLFQVGLFHSVADYTAARGAINIQFSIQEYWIGLVVGLAAAGLLSGLFAFVFGRLVFGLRGPYFAIGTLGVAIAAGELVGAWDWVGGGGGISLPVYPSDDPNMIKAIWCFMLFGVAAITFAFVRWLYSTRYGHAINAIRDDEEKAEGMGIRTTRYKMLTWAMSAVPLGIAGGIYGNMVGFFEPLEVAFPTVTFGIFMVVMVLLGGKGTIWGPIIGALVFHVIKEVTWTYLEGTQWVVLGMLIVVIVVFFQQGIAGWMIDRYPAAFGRTLDQKREPAE